MRFTSEREAVAVQTGAAKGLTRVFSVHRQPEPANNKKGGKKGKKGKKADIVSTPLCSV